MTFKGIIKFQRKVVADKRECYGCVYVNDDKFRVLIAQCAGESFDKFAETIFHELLHLGCFVIAAVTGASTSERKQHELINVVMPRLLNSRALQALRGKTK